MSYLVASQLPVEHSLNGLHTSIWITESVSAIAFVSNTNWLIELCNLQKKKHNSKLGS